MAFLTNMIADGIGEDCSGGEGALTQTLLTIFTHTGGIFGFCQSFPALRFFISPPSIRHKPIWYPKFRPIILNSLQQDLQTRPPNLQLLEDHPGVLDPDGVHFNILSGIDYVQDLHDQAVQLSLVPPPDPKLR